MLLRCVLVAGAAAVLEVHAACATQAIQLLHSAPEFAPRRVSRGTRVNVLQRCGAAAAGCASLRSGSGGGVQVRGQRGHNNLAEFADTY
jgi:hypothetical protein